MKKRMSWDEITLHKPYYVWRSSRTEGVFGFDTESLVTGYAFLLTDSSGRYVWIRSADDALTFLTNPMYQHTFNTFWNMSFDATVILKWLGKDATVVLASGGRWHHGEWAISFVPGKLMQIIRGKEFYTYYDASQFFVPRSLDGASKVYLGKSKGVPLGFESKEFYESAYGSEIILEYCIDDALLCGELTRVLLWDLMSMGITPRTLASPATVIEGAISDRGIKIPDMTAQPSSALEYAYNSYHGGWMECYQRGYFRKLWRYDISSAYPYQVSMLEDMSRGTWTHIRGRLPSSAAYGFVYCEVTIDSEVSPIMYTGDVNYTPRGTWLTFLTIEEVKFIRKHRLGTVEVKDGWFFQPLMSGTYLYGFLMRSLFQQRGKIKNAWLPKALGVSLYGKFGQKDDYGNSGRMFNPVYAAYITSRTRLAVAEYALANPGALVLTTSDGLVTSSPLEPKCLSNHFGGLRLAHFADGVVVGSNVHTLRRDRVSGTWRPGRFNWFKLLAKNPEATVHSLKHFRYSTIREGDFEAIGQFGDFEYMFDINFDHKRLFKKMVRGGDLLVDSYPSRAWAVGIPQRRRELMWALK